MPTFCCDVFCRFQAQQGWLPKTAAAAVPQQLTQYTILFRAEKQQQQQLRNVPIKSGGEEQKTLSQLKAEMYNKETATATSKKLRKGLAIWLRSNTPRNSVLPSTRILGFRGRMTFIIGGQISVLFHIFNVLSTPIAVRTKVVLTASNVDNFCTHC